MKSTVPNTASTLATGSTMLQCFSNTSIVARVCLIKGSLVVMFLLTGVGTMVESNAQSPEGPTRSAPGNVPPAQDSEATHELPLPDPQAQPQGFPNLKFGTMGGKQFWTDFLWRDDYRIQQNFYTGHFRLLNPRDQRLAWGNYSHCVQRLEKAHPIPAVAEQSTDVIVVIHGLGRSRGSMKRLTQFLRENTEARVLSFGYASTRRTLSDHARALHHMLEHLEGKHRVSFVCHSLGNLVVRRMLAEHGEDEAWQYGRMVMLGPPNLGAQLARRFQNNILFNLAWGQSGKQLAKTWEQLEPRLATPTFEFGVIAGGAEASFSNPLVDGEDDLIVSVEETRLPGAADFRHVEAFHTWLPTDAQVHQLALKFLESGYFETSANAEPIARTANSSSSSTN